LTGERGEIGLNSGRQVAPLKLTKRLNSIRRTISPIVADFSCHIILPRILNVQVKRATIFQS
jgi:hypothetical protein